LNADLTQLTTFDPAAPARAAPAAIDEVTNGQDQATWQVEAAVIAGTRRLIVWRSPSRHEGPAIEGLGLLEEGVFVGEGAFSENIPATTHRDDERIAVQGGRERGLVVHKLLEEVLTGETEQAPDILESRARALLCELGVAEVQRAEDGPHAPELAASVMRALNIPEVAELRQRLLAEMTVFSAESTGQGTIYVGGVADALALDGNNNVEVVIDWKSDVEPSTEVEKLYREQVRDYLAATGGKNGLLVFVTSGRVERVVLD
jgi:exodeoxyribonuclease-5